MLMPLEALQIDLQDYEDCDPKVRQLANFCAELLQAVRFTVNKQ